MFSLRFLIFFLALVVPSAFAGKKVVCYFAAWSAGRSDDGRFTVLNSDTEHCTHVVHAFMGLNETSSQIMSIEPYVDTNVNGIGENSLEKMKQLKVVNSEIKIMVSMGGWNQGSVRFSRVAKDPAKRLIFINSILKFLKKWELDGFDLCWQFPTQRGGLKEDKDNVITLLREMKRAFKDYKYILSVHMIAKRFVMDSYKIEELSDIVDFINLMALEYHLPEERLTGIMAPLKSKDQMNVEFSVNYMIKKKAARKKLLLGMPTYGHAYLLPKQPTSRADLLGQYTEELFSSRWTNQKGLIAYSEFCLDLKNNEWTELWDEESQTPISYNGRKFVTLDNGTSLHKKAELVATKSLGGVAFWSMDMDDFRGLCSGIPYPLISSVADYLKELPDEPETRPDQEEEYEDYFENDQPTTTMKTLEQPPEVQHNVAPKSESKNTKHSMSSSSRIQFSTILVICATATLAVFYN